MYPWANQIANLLCKQKVSFSVWSLQLQTHIHSQITLTHRKQTYLLFTGLMGEFCSDTKSTTKSLLNKLKHIPHWFLDERPSAKLGESNKKRGIFRLEGNPPVSLQRVSFGPQYFGFWVIFRIKCYQGKWAGKWQLEPFIWGLLITGHHRYNL